VLKEDPGLAVTFDKTNILVTGILAAYAHAAGPQNACLPILHLSPLFPPASFVVDGYIGLGATVPIGTDDLIQHFDRCEAITVYVDKVDSIQDGFIHRKFCFRRAAFYQSYTPIDSFDTCNRPWICKHFGGCLEMTYLPVPTGNAGRIA
jgi:hypothetical protein